MQLSEHEMKQTDQQKLHFSKKSAYLGLITYIILIGMVSFIFLL